MSCYHPMLGVPNFMDGLNENGKYTYKIQGPWTPDVIHTIHPKCVRIPCGHCIGCQMDKARSWADRMALELETYNGKAIFITLTYNEEHIPTSYDWDSGEFFGYTLDKKDWQDFMKRLRSRKQFEDKKLRFYACGEYGSKTHRPHMHGIIFGLNLEDFPDRKQKGHNELGQAYYISPLLEEIWSKGFTMLCDVSYKTCAYVARYVQKKAYGDNVPYGCLPEFQLMSRNPGIGRPYLESHPDCLQYSNLFARDGVEIRLPKYFITCLKDGDPRKQALLDERKKLASDAAMRKLQNTDLSYGDQLAIEEKVFENKVSVLTKLRK